MDPIEPDHSLPRDPTERFLKGGQRIYLAGDTEPYVVLAPGAWVTPAPEDTPSPRGGWMP